MDDSRTAVFSDIHANLEAVQAVVADIAGLGIRKMICLGDIVGYAANPSKCVKLVREIGCPVVQGNHDAAAAGDDSLEEMRDVAQRGIEFSRAKLSVAERAYLAALPLTFSDGRCEFVHASIDAPAEWNYVMGEYDALAHFASQKLRLAFCGHTHFPMVWHLGDTGNLKAWRGQGRIELPPGGKTLINVGSVGQPRDGCASACYVVCDPKSDTIEFRRVEYDIAKARRKIMRAKLPEFIAQRLSLGM